MQAKARELSVAKETNDVHPQPFLKWAGGKRQLLQQIRQHFPASFNTYFEPFVGAGAVLFELSPAKGVINDINSELINCYKVIRDSPMELLADLEKHRNEREYFQSIRELDRNDGYVILNDVERASRIIYLNKTCFNGLFRVNSKGYFNVPFGRNKNPRIANKEVILSVSAYLQSSEVEILNTDFASAVATAKRNDFVYFDPPYDPLSMTSLFTSYSLPSFGKDQQIQLRDLFRKLTKKGCKVMVSNSCTPFIEELYKDYRIIKVQASRSINSKVAGRKKIDEVLVVNY